MSEGNKLSRQELYDKIRETSKDEYILSEMQRLGFWPKDSEAPSLAGSLIKERAELHSKLHKLNREKNLYSDPKAALKELHKQRKKEALQRREETKQRRNQERFERKKRWHDVQQKMITFLGQPFSFGLKNVDSDAQKLAAQNLPELHDSKALAKAMGVSINELRFLVYQKDVSKISHYQRFQILKKTGGTRTISAPMPRLKRAQYWILANLLEPLNLNDKAHGFVSERSILTNAQPHIAKDVVINMDLKDFFPSITYKRVKGLFAKLGYSEHIATLLALICTESDSQEVQLDGESWHVANGERHLPQGAPTSPYISNLITRKLDARLSGLCEKYGFEYTRYADDLSFSGNKKSDKEITRLLWACRKIVADEGFTVHPEKTRIMRSHKKQEVTGVVVNDKASVDRKTLKKFRAVLFHIEKDGPEGKTWGNGNIFNAIEGYANYVAMIDPEKGIPLQKRVVDIKRKYGENTKPGKITTLNKKLFKIQAAQGKGPRADWWQPSTPETPELEQTQHQIEEQKKAEKNADSNANTASNRSSANNNHRTNNNERTREQRRRPSQANTNPQQEQTNTDDNPNKETQKLGRTFLWIMWIGFILYIIFFRR